MPALLSSALLPAVSPVELAAQTQGDTIVRTVTAPVHRGVARLIPELTVGVESGHPGYELAGVSALALSADGHVFVIDGHDAPIVRQYDANGRFVRNIGRKGRGPGEYIAPAGLAVLADGRLIVFEPGSVGGNSRINVYSRDGASSDTWRMPYLNVPNGAPKVLRVDRSGMIYVKYVHTLMQGSVRTHTTQPILRVRNNGSVIDTLPQPDLPEIFDAGSMLKRKPPFAFLPSWDLNPFGDFLTSRLAANGNGYILDIRMKRTPATGATGTAVWQAGDRVMSVRRTTPAVPITAAERADRRARLQGQSSLNVPEVPAVKPPLRFVMFAEDGRLWAQLYQPSERADGNARWRERFVWDVFEPDGRYVGQVAQPLGVNLLAMQGDHVWGAHTSELGVPLLTRYRIVWQ